MLKGENKGGTQFSIFSFPLRSYLVLQIPNSWSNQNWQLLRSYFVVCCCWIWSNQNWKRILLSLIQNMTMKNEICLRKYSCWHFFVNKNGILTSLYQNFTRILNMRYQVFLVLGWIGLQKIKIDWFDLGSVKIWNSYLKKNPYFLPPSQCNILENLPESRY